MILIEPSTMGVGNLKLLLLYFKNMSGLNINFNKKEAVVIGVEETERRRVADKLNCKRPSYVLLRASGFGQSPTSR